MRSRTRSLFPVLAALVALMTLGMPEGVAGQGKGGPTGCTECRKEDGEAPECVPKPKGEGYDDCINESEKGDCTLSSDKPDCGLVVALDGRAQDGGSGVATVAVGGMEVAPGLRPEVPAVRVPTAVARHACTGAIVNRRYSSATIAQLITGLRRVTI